MGVVTDSEDCQLGRKVAVKASSTSGCRRRPAPSKPRLFRTTLPVISSVVEQYRVTADGQRFLLCLLATSVQREPLGVL